VTTESTTTKNAGKSLDVLMAMATQLFNTMRMEHIQGYTGSHWMPPLGECLRHIAPAAAMVNKFDENTPKH
jgi:hypothetical protein